VDAQTITVSQAAAARIKHLAQENSHAAPSLRIGVRRAGCSGMAYTIDLAEDKLPLDAVVESDGVTVCCSTPKRLCILPAPSSTSSRKN
jgi:iron-sulfur cluster assembly protein